MRPNILVITTHDTGRHLGCYGVPTVNSPHLDRLATEGVKLTRYFAAAPICCASRATQMTGRYPQSHGLMDLCFPPFSWEMHPTERHLASLLREAGYRTHLFGMQHETAYVERLGFDAVAPNLPMPACEVVARQVATFLATSARAVRPFYAQVGFFETHSPFDWGGATPDMELGVHVPPYLAASDLVTTQLAQFQGMIRKADSAIGTILQALSAAGLADNTILVYTTDHGIEFPRAKWHLYDPGLEIAAIWRWPAGGIIGGRTCPWLLSNVDFVPTLLELARVPHPTTAPPIEGISFAGGLVSNAATPTRQCIYAMYEQTENRAIRTERHKLILSFRVSSTWDHSADPTRPADYAVTPNVQLFDLQADPLEFHNLAESPTHREICADLIAQLYRWLEQVNDPLLQGPTRTPFYEHTIALRGLPAAAAEPSRHA